MKTFHLAIVIAAFICLVFWSINTTAQERGSITGRVVTETGKPLVNIQISLGSQGGGSRSTSTDAEGKFQFNGLADRAYSVFTTPAQGYISKPLPIEDRNRRYRPGDSIIVTMVKGGVITGQVTDSNGNPVVSIPIALIRVRDGEGNKQNVPISGPQRSTNDRGVYRIYGLQPGTYIVAANSGGVMGLQQQFSPYHGQMPTYHPSATRDTAMEVQVSLGIETSGIDIRFRGETGRTISGKVVGGEALITNNLASVSLVHAATEAQIGNDLARPNAGQSVFSIQGISDGEYILTATHGNYDTDEIVRSEPRRITVKGTDITGLTLTMTPMALITGRVVVEKSPNVCDAKLPTNLRDVSLTAWFTEKTGNALNLLTRFAVRGGNADESGNFKINNLTPGLQRLKASSRNESWFVKSISGATRSSIAADLVRSGLMLKPGERLAGVTVTVTDGAASLSGKLAPAREGDTLPAKMRAHLIPAEPAAAENLLRYLEVPTGNSAFALTGIAPGKYWLLAKPIAEDEPTSGSPPVAWDAAERTKLRKEAEAAKNEIELKSCQRVKDHVLRW